MTGRQLLAAIGLGLLGWAIIAGIAYLIFCR